MVKNFFKYVILLVILSSCSTTQDGIKLSEDNTFKQNWAVYRLNNTDAKGEIPLKVFLPGNSQSITITNYELEPALTRFSLEERFISINPNTPYFIEDDTYYFYDYTESVYFETEYLFEKDITWNKVDKDSLYVMGNKNYTFVLPNAYVKRKIIEKDTLKNLSGVAKHKMLLYLIDDIKKAPLYSTNYDFLLRNLEKEVQKKTVGYGKEQKILELYRWAVETLVYKYEPENPAIFSGLETYYKKEGVCDGYSKLFIYMLLFAGIEDTEQVVGHVLNSEDLGIVWHAWVKIGDYYYDPTFENTRAKNRDINRYFYFQLPKDLMNVDRIEGIDALDKKFADLSLEERKIFVEKSYLYLLENKIYDYKDYPLLEFYARKNILTNGVVRELKVSDFVNALGITKINPYGELVYKGQRYRLREYSEILLKDEANYLEAVLYFLGDKTNVIIIEIGGTKSLFYDMTLEK